MLRHPHLACSAAKSEHSDSGTRSARATDGKSVAVVGLEGAADSAPFGIVIRVRAADGTEAKAVRSYYAPGWQDENRNLPLPFVPVQWHPL